MALLDDPEVRKDLARAYVRLEGLRLNVAEQLSMRVSGRVPGPEGSVAKLLWAEAEQALPAHGHGPGGGPTPLTGRHPERLEGYFRLAAGQRLRRDGPDPEEHPGPPGPGAPAGLTPPALRR